VQDIYSVHKEKVAVGKIISGEIKKGEKVTILPLYRECYVKEIKLFNNNKSVARVSENIGLILDDMDNVGRSQIICKPILPKVYRDILAKIFCVHHLDINEPLRLRCLAQESFARVSKINAVWDIASLESKPKNAMLNEADVAEVAIVTENPIVLEKYEGFNSLGRFILQNDNREICAVGIII